MYHQTTMNTTHTLADMRATMTCWQRCDACQCVYMAVCVYVCVRVYSQARYVLRGGCDHSARSDHRGACDEGRPPRGAAIRGACSVCGGGWAPWSTPCRHGVYTHTHTHADTHTHTQTQTRTHTHTDTHVCWIPILVLTHMEPYSCPNPHPTTDIVVSGLDAVFFGRPYRTGQDSQNWTGQART